MERLDLTAVAIEPLSIMTPSPVFRSVATSANFLGNFLKSFTSRTPKNRLFSCSLALFPPTAPEGIFGMNFSIGSTIVFLSSIRFLDIPLSFLSILSLKRLIQSISNAIFSISSGVYPML